MLQKMVLVGVLLMLAAIAGFYLARRGWEDAGSAAAPQPAVTDSTQPLPEVPIQDHATIDFSSGQPVVKATAEEKAIIDRAVGEMEKAAKDATFGPIPPSTQSPEQKTPPEPLRNQPGN